MFIFWMKSWNSYLKGLDNLLENGWSMYLKQRIKNWDSELKHCKVPIYQSVNEILGNIIKLTNDNRSLFVKLNWFLLDTCCKNEWKCLKNPQLVHKDKGNYEKQGWMERSTVLKTNLEKLLSKQFVCFISYKQCINCWNSSLKMISGPLKWLSCTVLHMNYSTL